MSKIPPPSLQIKKVKMMSFSQAVVVQHAPLQDYQVHILQETILAAIQTAQARQTKPVVIQKEKTLPFVHANRRRTSFKVTGQKASCLKRMKGDRHMPDKEKARRQTRALGNLICPSIPATSLQSPALLLMPLHSHLPTKHVAVPTSLGMGVMGDSKGRLAPFATSKAQYL